MSAHATHYGGVPPETVGRELAKLRYDALATILAVIGQQLEADSRLNDGLNRENLAARLHDAAVHATVTANDLARAWELVKIVMRKDD